LHDVVVVIVVVIVVAGVGLGVLVYEPKAPHIPLSLMMMVILVALAHSWTDDESLAFYSSVVGRVAAVVCPAFATAAANNLESQTGIDEILGLLG
jgi:ribose/xylose/arabinose/galactoside ABC-type transport system permease subunit